MSQLSKHIDVRLSFKHYYMIHGYDMYYDLCNLLGTDVYTEYLDKSLKQPTAYKTLMPFFNEVSIALEECIEKTGAKKFPFTHLPGKENKTKIFAYDGYLFGHEVGIEYIFDHVDTEPIQFYDGQVFYCDNLQALEKFKESLFEQLHLNNKKASDYLIQAASKLTKGATLLQSQEFFKPYWLIQREYDRQDI